MARIKISKDGSGTTWGYELLDSDGISVMESDGYESVEEIIKDLTSLNQHLTDALNNVPVVQDGSF